MPSRMVVFGLLPAFSLLGAAKKPAAGHSANEQVEIAATVFADKDAIKQMLGSDLDGHFIVLELRVAPKYGKLAVHRDDFLLRTDKDGEKSTPFAPSQIAGRGALIVSQSGGGRGIMGDNAGPVWGGYPGSGERPRRLGGDGGAIGNTGESSAQSAVHSGSKEKESPLMQVLKTRELPEKESDGPLSGLLYFPLEKQKVKDLELIYTTPSGKLSVRFR